MIRPIARVGATKNTAQDAPGAIFSRGALLRYPPYFGDAHPQRTRSCCNVLENFRGVEDDVDAAVPVDAQNAPTRDLENCKERSFPQRPHRSSFLAKRTKERSIAFTDQPSTKSDQVHPSGRRIKKARDRKR